MKFKPSWYTTPQEFADLIIESLYDNGYFIRGEKYHPEDIESAFSSASHSMVKAFNFVGRKVAEENINKNNLY